MNNIFPSQEAAACHNPPNIAYCDTRDISGDGWLELELDGDTFNPDTYFVSYLSCKIARNLQQNTKWYVSRDLASMRFCSQLFFSFSYTLNNHIHGLYGFYINTRSVCRVIVRLLHGMVPIDIYTSYLTMNCLYKCHNYVFHEAGSSLDRYFPTCRYLNRYYIFSDWNV